MCSVAPGSLGCARSFASARYNFLAKLSDSSSKNKRDRAIEHELFFADVWRGGEWTV
jgi:hypothetical protein